MAKTIYKTKLLLTLKDDGGNLFDYSQVFPERQKALQDQLKYDFNLQQVMEMLREQTNNFTIENNVAQALDLKIYETVMMYFKEKGIEPNIEVETGEEKKPVEAIEPAEPEKEEVFDMDAAKGEWIIFIEQLQELIDAKEGSKEEIEEWQGFIEQLQELLAD